MKALHLNWITEGQIDFEYKKYILLAYLQNISEQFKRNKVYPFLSDIIAHYYNLKLLQNGKNEVKNQMPKNLQGIDSKAAQLLYEPNLEPKFIEEIEAIINYAIPTLKSHLETGSNLYEFALDQIHIEPVGVMPLRNEHGYLLVRKSRQNSTEVYQYQVTIFENSADNFRGIRTEYIRRYEGKLSNTFENIKSELIRSRKDMPNPATYAVQSESQLPFKETLLPIAKRHLVRMLAEPEDFPEA